MTLLVWRGPLSIIEDQTLELKRTIEGPDRPDEVAVSPDGNWLVWREFLKSDFHLLELTTGKTTIIPAGRHSSGMTFSPDSKWLAIGDVKTPASDIESGYCELKLYDTAGKLVQTFAGSKQGALTPAFSPNGKIVAVGNRNYETRLFEAESGKLLHTLPRAMTYDIAFRPDGKVLITSYAGSDRLGAWNVETGKPLDRQPTPIVVAGPIVRETSCVEWSPAGDLLVTAGNLGKVILWDGTTLEKLHELEIPLAVTQVCFNAAGDRLFISSRKDGTPTAAKKTEVWAIAGEDK